MFSLLASARAARRLAAGTVAIGATFAAALPLGAQMAAGTDGKPTIAIIDFTNSALVRHADYAPLSSGIADVLITELAGNPRVHLVEREQIQKLIEEQNLGAGGRVDKETAAKVGKILGARHFITGTFVIDTKERIRLDVRSINTETSEIEYTQSVMGKAEDVFALIDQLADRINLGLNLPAAPAGTRSSSVATPASTVASTSAAKPDHLRAMLALGRGLQANDHGNSAVAVAAYREAVQADPTFERAKVRLAMAERPNRTNDQ